MTIFNFLRFCKRSGAKPARRAPRSRTRVLGAQFELLESRCFLSVSPPSASLVLADNAQYASFYMPSLVSRDFAAAGGNMLSSISGPIILPSLPSGGSYPGAALPRQQFQPLPAQDGVGGLAILNGMIDIGGLSFNNAQVVPMVLSGAVEADHESRAVQDMLSSLRYVPMASQVEEDSQQSTLALSTPSSAPSPPSSSPAFPSSEPSAPTGAPSAYSSPPSLPSSPSPSTPSGAPSPASSYAPTSTSPDSIGRQPAQHDNEGGMVSLVRQPVAQASTVDKISIAALDALLEIPAKVDGMQGRFQAFEISVTSETPLPVAPLPVGAQINLPFDPANQKTPPVTDPNLHGAWVPSGSAGAIPQFSLPSTDFSNTAFLSAAAPLAEEALPLGELPHEAIDAALGELSTDATDDSFSSSPQLDLATATLLAALIGRAIWPARVRKAAGQDKTANAREASSPAIRLGLDPIVPD
jgi:hypothetical protein